MTGVGDTSGQQSQPTREELSEATSRLLSEIATAFASDHRAIPGAATRSST